MYRDRPPPRGGYPPPPRPYLPSSHRDDRNRPRSPFRSDYLDQVQRDPYRRSPPRRRFPSPGPGSHRRGEMWVGGPPRERSPSPRRPAPLDHNLVITVGNELTGPSGTVRLQNRDYERNRSPDRSPERRRAKSRGRSKSRPRSQSRSPNRNRAKSRGRSRSRSLDRNRAKSRGRSKSRPRSQSRSPGRNRAKSRGRSRSRSLDRNRAKSRGQSRNRHRSRFRSRSRSRGRSYSRAASRARSKSRRRSRSGSSGASSTSSSSDDRSRRQFRELETARRRKELEEMLGQPTKSILKRRHDSDDSPSLRSTDSPRVLDGSNVSQVAEQLLLAVKGLEPHRVVSVLSELRSDPGTAQSADVREILQLLGGQAEGGAGRQEKNLADIDDEEKFLYGDSEEPDPPPAPEAVQHHGLDLYGEVTEETLYGDYPAHTPVAAHTYGMAPPLQAAETRYASRPTIDPDQSIRVRVSKPSCPPGTEPLEAGERQALEEYEKLQDLLTTIGLDLGVADLSKMAARTKERLHGSRPPPKTPTRRRRYSSDSSDNSRRSPGGRSPGRRSHSGGSSSRSRSRGRGFSWSSEDGGRKSSAPPKPPRDVNNMKSDAAPLPRPSLDHNTLPPHGGMPIPTYPPPQVQSMMPPNFPPTGYGQYGNYLSYMHQQWPPMYPPPNMAPPPQMGPQEAPPTLPFNTADPEVGVKGSASSRDKRASEEENNESQKQKVLEEREKLKEERESRMKKKECLMKELERLRKHQGELLRKKRREKGGHKDPLLEEISRLQEEVMTQISMLRKEHEAAEKKRTEIDKVALILGLSASDRPRRTNRPDQEDGPPPEKKNQEPERSPKEGPAASSSVTKTSALQPPFRPVQDTSAVVAPPPDPFEYYDAGNHWCKNCNVTSGSMFDFFTHLHSKTHKKTLDPYERPWASPPSKMIVSTGPEEKLAKPAKGSEFLLPVRGFFCLLCREFFGDGICAEEHVTTHAHNEKYKKRMYENPLYEQRRNLDRQAGLASDATTKKRKHEDDEKRNGDKEEKSKQKKEKKDKEKKRVEDDSDEDIKDPTILEGARPSSNKKNEDEKYEYSKKDDKYRYSREQEDRDKYSRRDEDKYTSSKEGYQFHYRKGEDSRYGGRPKYEPRADEHKYKYGKYSDFRSKHDNDRDEGKPKADKESFKKPESVKPVAKPEVSKPQPLPKPYDPPKILCGPSPAMRAKLRKQSMEASKSAPPVTTSPFGKFAWKKKENTLAKEAQKVAAEFIKDDEASEKHDPVSEDDPFSKSVAVAKEIAERLGCEQNMPPPSVSNAAYRGKIRPNLPVPAAGLRRATMMGKPASLNTFLSIRPQSSTVPGPAPKDGPIFPDATTPTTLQSVGPPNPNLRKPPPKDEPQLSGPQAKAQNTLLESKSGQTLSPMPGPAVNSSKLETKPIPPCSKLVPFDAKPTEPLPKSASVEVQSMKPAPKTSPVIAKPLAAVSKPVPFLVNSAPPVSKSATNKTTAVVSTAQPSQPAMIKIEPDVAAPGVPESEQTHTVFVKPPPFMGISSGARKSEKLKTNLAAAKAQDLFDIFYSSVGQAGASSITKPAAHDRTNSGFIGKSQLPTPQAQKLQPEHQNLTNFKPPIVVCPSPQSGCLSLKTQPEPEFHIASVRSLQSTSLTLPGGAPSETTSPTVQPKPDPPVQPEVQSIPEESSTPGCQINPKTGPSQQNPTCQTQALPKPSPPNQTESEPEPQLDRVNLPLSVPSYQLEGQGALVKHSSTSVPNTPLQIESQFEQDQDTQPAAKPENHSDPSPEPKPGPKTRGKTTKSPPVAILPARQTRSQTRYQTRQQQESQPEPASGDSDTVAPDPKGLDTSDPGSALIPDENPDIQGDSISLEIMSETLDLTSEFTTLDFETDFNFD